jgi:chromosome segregation ATPase
VHSMMIRNRLLLNSFICILLSFIGCSSVYYSVWESLGKEKRDLLKDKVESTRDQQLDTAEQFEDALSALRAAYNPEPSELSALYDSLKAEYESSESETQALQSRIESMHNVAADLFAEWEEEAESIDNKRFRSDSLQKLTATKNRYQQMRGRLLSSAAKMNRVLSQFRDYVIYLKHNLNAQSLNSLEKEAVSIETDIRTLISQIQSTVNDTEDFIRSL